MDPATPAISKNPNLTALLSAENGLAPYRDPLGCPSTDSNQSLSQSHLSIPPVTGDDDGNIDSIGVDGTIISPATTSLASEALSEASPSQALVPSHLSKRLFAREDGDANPAAFPPPQQALVRYSDRFDRVPDCGAHPQSYLSNPSAVQDNREIGATGTDSTRSGLEATTAALESTMMPKATSSEGSASMLESGDIDASSWFVMLGAVSIFEPYTCREPIRDVLDLILQYLIMVLSKSQLHQYTRPKAQSRISRTSLTCRHWAQKLRLLLFEDVKLKTMDDVRFVLTMLHSPTSSWLADHILAVILYPGVEHPYPHQATLEACKEVLRLCRSVGYIDVSHSTKTIRKNHLSICTQRPFLRTLSKLRILRLEFVVFPSLSSLFRLIGSLEQLQYLNVLGPFWKKTNDTTTDVMPWQTPPSCRAMFKQMKTTLWSEGPDNTAAMWLFAGRSIQHSYKMRFRENEETLPLELAAIVRLIYTLCPGSGRDTVEARMLLDRDDTYAFAMRRYGSIVIGSAAIVFITQYMPSTSYGSKTEGKWFLQRLVVVGYMPGRAQEDKDGRVGCAAAWAKVDGLLASFSHLQSIDILCKDGRPAYDVAVAMQMVSEDILSHMSIMQEKVSVKTVKDNDGASIDDPMLSMCWEECRKYF